MGLESGVAEGKRSNRVRAAEQEQDKDLARLRLCGPQAAFHKEKVRTGKAKVLVP